MELEAETTILEASLSKMGLYLDPKELNGNTGCKIVFSLTKHQPLYKQTNNTHFCMDVYTVF